MSLNFKAFLVFLRKMLTSLLMPSAAAKSSYTLPCSAFNSMCADMDSYTLLDRYYRFYQPPRFYPSIGPALALYRTKKDVLKPLVAAFQKEEYNDVTILRRGQNVHPPAVGVVYDAWITKAGSVLGDDVFISMWPDTFNLTDFRHQYFPTAKNQTSKDGEWKKVKEVVVISHTHQVMFWHMMVSEYFRLSTLLPYVQANEHIYIHLGWQFPNPLIKSLYAFLNISEDRLLWNTKVQADVVYYTQYVERNDVPSIGMTQLISQTLLNALEVPEDRRLSVLAIDDPAKVSLPKEDIELNILFMVRKPHGWKGRIILNYDEVKEAILDLVAAYPAKLQRLSTQDKEDVDIQEDDHYRTGHLKINFIEHHAHMNATDGMKLFSEADIIMGPHGAGFINLFAARPGAHVVELITSRHLNLYTSARLGLTFHGCIAMTSREGISEQAPAPIINFIADVNMLTTIVESILDSRFVPASSRASGDSLKAQG
ncbi:uncharacterized protein ACA1_384600 [Acanthamoeba castellanii str. Neff]|uniref:Glycosyltransferase 61 catalytic domain-containing protein n=1 Tax=Acanthamoeba castellanii (strain ATCC 30010 / Neff) TaxID=1257118 RepID=L8H974_ACACF|nr:uncharacterized protein ACA1_384600 [Acanthamoeba castellanii str. Neff]ELR21725.1 hypothetical protein ACA1_384600 [Acanthamoeba castellanii str. Neff]